MWDNPHMKLVTDDRGRLTSAGLFRPNTAFDATPQPDGSIRVVQLREAKVPTLKPQRVNGRLRLPVKISREIIAAAVRADRDER
jgi:hypothetical protein